MEPAVKLAWFLLGLLHVPPAATAVSPRLVQRLYGVAPSGDLELLVMHRGVLFCAIVTSCVLGAFDPAVRRALGVVVGTTMVGYLLLYWRAGMPTGPLRVVAFMDLLGLAPLAFALWSAWRRQAA
jgi:hypothetical protein